MKVYFIFFICFLPTIVFGGSYKTHTVLNDRLSVQLSDGVLDIIPLSEQAIRIQFKKDSLTEKRELILVNKLSVPEFRVSETGSKLQLSTKAVRVTYDETNDALVFSDSNGKVFLSEKPGSRELTRGLVEGEPCFVAQQSFDSPDGEYLFGLGQFQDGQLNLRNVSRKLIQVNSQISIPFIYSSRGYGLLWHQYGLTDFNPADNYITLSKQEQSSAGNQVAEVTTTAGTQKVSQNQSLYNGKFDVPSDGEYSLFLDLGSMGNRHFVAIDGKPVIDQSNMWLPPAVGTLVKLIAGEHQVQVLCKSDNTPRLSWKQQSNTTTFRSPNAKLLDYVVFAGKDADEVIKNYRTLSGNAPMFPQWAFGFWQCRERYSSGSQLVGAVQEFRKRQLPMDVIVQDWQYWGNRGWGVPQFDETNYADPKKFIKEIHDQHAHFNISIWSNPDKNSDLGKAFVAQGLFIPGTKWLDYFNPETRKEYWNALKINMFDNGVDSWWMDAVEPENDALKGERTYAGLGDFYRLTYPYFVTKAVSEGQRETSAAKRVCILTRSAFPGQQRYGIINWSGDIGGNWDAFRRQIVAGLGYTITGFPYWTTDIGGFFRPGPSQYTDEKYHELLTRWFQWGAFNPIFRIHGYMTETEPWKYGPQVEENMREMLNLRYQLMPYIYSGAWQITSNGSTMMRPLVMDFSADQTALNQQFEYMFGQSFLVAPVTEPSVSEWKVYLPKAAAWYDFWTDRQFAGGQTVKTTALLSQIPLFVKAGSVVPMGKILQYTGQKSADTLDVRVYPGADGKFTLYEDENDNYDYEKGVYSTITFSWNDAKKVLTIGNRQGSFPGMLNERIFNIVLAGKTVRTDTNLAKPTKQVRYQGKKEVINLK